MTFASSETQGESVGSRKTAAKLFKAWRESPKSPWDVRCDLPRVHSGDWRLAIGDCVWAQKLCAIRWADSLRLRLCPIGGQHLLHGFRDLVIRSSCKLDCSPCAICHEFIRMLVSSDLGANRCDCDCAQSGASICRTALRGRCKLNRSPCA